jgi:hypothetical protein
MLPESKEKTAGRESFPLQGKARPLHGQASNADGETFTVCRDAPTVTPGMGCRVLGFVFMGKGLDVFKGVNI